MDNGTMVKVFKYLNYLQLANNSLVSTRFWNLIRTHRHSLALLYVDKISMEDYPTSPLTIKMFDSNLSPEEYNEWVVRNQYSKQIPLEGQIAEKQSLQNNRAGYKLSADKVAIDSNGLYNIKSVLFARAKLIHENWPLFQHFVCLLTDPFIYVRDLKLTTQNDVVNLLAGTIYPNRNRLQCNIVTFNLDGDIQKLISWMKNNVRCDKFEIANYTLFTTPNYDEDLLDFFVTGANCTSRVNVVYYDIYNIIFAIVTKFMDLKSSDECHIVKSIRGNISYGNGNKLKHDYAKFFVKKETCAMDDSNGQYFVFVNNDIGKKLQLAIFNQNWHQEVSTHIF